MRDCPVFTLYFGTFEFLKKKFGVSENDRLTSSYHGMSESAITFWKFMAGGLAAMFSWSFFFPFDSLKTRM